MRISYTCFVQSNLTFFWILFFKIKKYLIFFHYIKINNENIIIFYNLFYWKVFFLLLLYIKKENKN